MPKCKYKFSKHGKISKNNPREQKTRGVKKYYDSLNGTNAQQIALRLFHVFKGWIENQERKAVLRRRKAGGAPAASTVNNILLPS